MLGRIQLHLFTESKTSQGEWAADSAATFNQQESPVSGRPVPSMEETPCPQDLPLFGVLCDGAWESLPWSFWQRGLPDDLSPQVLALSQEWAAEGFGHNHLTLQELLDKYEELKSDSRPQARLIAHSLGEMLYALMANSKTEASPDSRRVVFWFH